MNVIRCDKSTIDLAIDAMVTIKCVEDGKPPELVTIAAMTKFLDNPFNHLLVAVDGSETVGCLIAYELQRPDHAICRTGIATWPSSRAPERSAAQRAAHRTWGNRSASARLLER